VFRYEKNKNASALFIGDFIRGCKKGGKGGMPFEII
jgi:hypothetical protein